MKWLSFDSVISAEANIGINVSTPRRLLGEAIPIEPAELVANSINLRGEKVLEKLCPDHPSIINSLERRGNLE